MSSNNSRRDFLKHTLTSTPLLMSALRLSPFGLFMESIIKKAYGIKDVEGSNPFNYVGIMMQGAPPRWVFDLPLRPNGEADPFMASPMVNTQLINNLPTYHQLKIGKYYMPILWDKYIPVLSGGKVKMSELLQNIIMFRGYNLGVDGHGGNQVRHFRPNNGGTSIDGELGAKSSRPIPNVACGRVFGFSSPTGSSQIQVSLSDSNPLTTLMSNFALSSGDPLSMKAGQVEAAFDLVLKAMEAEAHQNNVPLKNTYANRINAKKVFKEEYGNLKDWYTIRYNEYRRLERECFSNHEYSLGPGIQEHEFLKTIKEEHGLPENYYRIQNINQRGTHFPEWGISFEDSISEETYVYAMSHTLTISEFLLQNKLTSALTLNWSNLRNVQIGDKKINPTNDGHSNGTLASMFLYSKMYQAIASGLNEFKNFLSSIDQFDKTVIQLSGDFNRSARFDGSGSDHGWKGTNTTVMSGMIKEHGIVGNCKTYTTGGHRGTWGVAAGLDFLGGSEMAFGHVASSIATMLECDSASENNPSLVAKDRDGVVKPISGVGAKNV
jgi:hypothetical protein